MAAAAATQRLRIGTGICLVIERDPIITAKEVASLDQLSGGRFCSGWAPDGTSRRCATTAPTPAGASSLMRERIEAMKTIWANDEATYHGAHVDFDRIWSWPKPVQRPHPPILVGGNGPHVIDRVLAFGDAWMPNRVPDDQIIPRFEELGRRAREAGRSIPITVAGMMRDPQRIERFERAGVHRSVFWLPASGPADVEAAFDRYQAAAEGYNRAGG